MGNLTFKLIQEITVARNDSAQYTEYSLRKATVIYCLLACSAIAAFRYSAKHFRP
jgi:hypothetical protein